MEQKIDDPVVALALQIGTALRHEISNSRLEVSAVQVTVGLHTDKGRLFATYRGVPPHTVCTVTKNGHYIETFYGHPETPKDS